VATISNLLFQQFTFLLLFPFCNPKTIDLHVLMVLFIGEIINTMSLPLQIRINLIDAMFQVESLNLEFSLTEGS
jgi:hypothetical protein